MLLSAAAAAGLVILGGVAIVVSLSSSSTEAGSPRPPATSQAAPDPTLATVAGQQAPDTPPDSTSTGTSSTGTSVPPTGSANGLVTVDAAVATRVSPDVAKAVVATLGSYFGNINARRPSAAYAMYSAEQQSRVPFPTWSAGTAQSTISDAVVVQLGGATAALGGAVTADVSFASRQPADRGPVPGQACTQWSLRYQLIPDPSGLGYLIDTVRALVGTGYRAC